MLSKRDIEAKGYKVTFTNGTGAGGQKRNRTYTKATVTHLELKISRSNDETRSARQNMNRAYKQMVLDLREIQKHLEAQDKKKKRKKAKDRGTIRTYNYKSGTVKNHITGKTAPLKKVLNGDIEAINKEF